MSYVEEAVWERRPRSPRSGVAAGGSYMIHVIGSCRAGRQGASGRDAPAPWERAGKTVVLVWGGGR